MFNKLLNCPFHSHNVNPVDARCPIPKAPGTNSSLPAPALEFAGRGLWMKFTTTRERQQQDFYEFKDESREGRIQTAVVP